MTRLKLKVKPKPFRLLAVAIAGFVYCVSDVTVVTVTALTVDPKLKDLDHHQEASVSPTVTVCDATDDATDDDNAIHSHNYEHKYKYTHPHPKWTIYCVQLYTETEDYVFRTKDGMGLSMYANRHLQADESVIQSPVGPGLHEGLFEVETANKNENENELLSLPLLSADRLGFAERFLKWHQTDGTTNPIGATNDKITIVLEDFYNPSTTSKKHRPLPNNNTTSSTTSSPPTFIYDLKIFEHEILLVEFVPPPSHPKHELPPQRRFEILHYGEGLLGLDGEEGYDPKTAGRPPTLCGMEMRSLEVPGHFSNHASGSTSSAYDIMTMTTTTATTLPQQQQQQQHQYSTDEDDDLPEWIVREMAARERASKTVLFAHLMARRDLAPGTEITTDYSKWNWCNSDWAYHGASNRTPIGFFQGNTNDNNDDPLSNSRWAWDDLSPRIQRAATILGYTRSVWEDESKPHQEISSTSSTTTTTSSPPPTVRKAWKKLSLQEQEAATILTGHTEESWNRRSDIEHDDGNGDDDAESYAAFDRNWEELSEEQSTAAASIGYTAQTWNHGGDDFSIIDGTDLYFYSLRPEIKDAYNVLGVTASTWESDDNDYNDNPVFECLCGDAHCHSSKEKGGFKGVKYFSLDDQRKLVPLCEPWVQQQFQWKLYQLEQQQQQEEEESKNV